MRYRFGPFELDEARYELRKEGELLALEPKPFALLLHLLRRHPQTCSRDELLDALWGDAAVTEASLSTAVRAIRRGLGEGAGDSVIRTVRGRGYALAVAVETQSPPDATAPGPTAVPRAPAPPVAPAPATAPGPLAAASGPPLFGRETERALCARVLEAACGGRSQILLLAGEPGIGKTRLGSEVASAAAGRGARVVWGRAHESGGQPAFWPFESALRELLDDDGLAARAVAALGGRAESLGRLLPGVGERLAAAESSRGQVGPEELRYRGFEAVVTLLRTAASKAPLCLLLDDLQWMDESSLELLCFIAHEIGASPVLLIGTYRDTEGDSHPALGHTLATLARAPSPALTLALEGLSPEELGQMVVHEGASERGEGWVESLHERTNGNPFFAGEILRLMSGARDPADVVPPGVQSVLRRRLTGLDPKTGALLATAAVIGRTFRVRVLAEAADEPTAAVLGGLQPAVRARMVDALPGGSGVFAFCHPLVQETLYADLDPVERAMQHARVAEVLERQAGDRLEPQLPQIAHHMAAAQPVVEAAVALDYQLRAAEYELRGLAFETAVHALERALALVDGSLELETSRAEVLLRLAVARGRAGQPEAAADTWRALVGYARGLGDARLLARAAAGLASTHVFTAASGAEEVASILREALEASPPGEGEPDALRARLLSALSRQLTWSSQRDQQLPLADEAATLARQSGDRDALIEVLGQRSMLLELRGDDASREDSYREIEALSRGGLDRETLARARILSLQHRIDHADGERIDAELAEYEKLAAELRQPTYRVFAARVRTMRALWRGELEQAEARIQEAYELGQKVDANHAVLVWSAQLGVLRRQQGRFVELEPGARGALEQHPKLVSFRCALTAMLVDDGRLDEARPLLASLAGGDFDALQEGDPNHWLNLSLLTEACVVLGESAHAGVLSARLASRRGRYVTVPHVVTLGCGSFHLANLAALRGELDEAEELLMEAVEVERRMQADPWLARSLIDLARVRLDREGSEAREAVRPLIAEAAGLVDRRGLDGVRGRLGEVARRLG